MIKTKKNWKKVCLSEAAGSHVFSDKFGYIDVRNITIDKVILKIKSGEEEVNPRYVFDRVNNQYFDIEEKFKNLKIYDLFEIDVFVLKSKYSGRYVYHHDSETYEHKAKIQSIFVRDPYGDRVVEIKSKDDLQAIFESWPKINVWTSKEAENSELKDVNKTLLNIGDLVYYSDRDELSNGVCEVTKIYQPNNKDLFCELSNLESKKIFNIEKNDLNMCQVPYLEYEDEFSQFDEMIDENSLKPYIIFNKNNGEFNAYWLKVEDASQYIVSVYKIIDYDKFGKKLYHLRDYFVERNVHFLSLSNLLGDNYIFRIVAENRDGEIIAKSRGIDERGEPVFGWKKKK